MTQDQRRTLFQPDPVVEAAQPVAVVAPSVAPIASTPEPVEEAPAEALQPRRSNPWLIGLWAWAIILIVLSVWAYTSSIAAQYQGYGGSSEEFWLTSDFAISTMKASFAPGVFAVGLATGAAATAISAVQWMRRHP